MKVEGTAGEVYSKVEELSSDFDYNNKETAIILAAGHGKRIKSQTSKMLHKIWEMATVERVYDACKLGIENLNTIVVVGIKAIDVMEVVGKKENSLFAYQEVQNGTGHAVQVALEKVHKDYDGIIYVLPGDMGLINKETMKMFRNEFIQSKSDMMVLTGIYEGDPLLNSYGRIVRVKEMDSQGNPSGDDFGKVIEIIEYKDILKLEIDKPYILNFNGREYSFTRQELIENNEFNSGVYAFDYKKLITLVDKLSSNNAQKEIYITDLISLFNQHGYTVKAVSPKEQYVLMGFNNKSVLLEMESIARSKVYDKLKDIVEIVDPDDFFIHDSVVEEILRMDNEGIPLDIKIGKGVYIGAGVKLNYNITFRKNARIESNIHFGKNVTVGENVLISCWKEQNLYIGENVEILFNAVIKGNVKIGDNTTIESNVKITGSDEFPTEIGKNVLVKGTTYIYGTKISDDILIEHSVLIKKKVEKIVKKNGTVVPIRFYLPLPEGMDAVEDI